MKSMIRRGAVGATGALMLVAMVVSSSPATAAPSGAVPFGQANFHGYANGTEIHLGALTAGTTTLANIDQAFSGASTNTAGLGTGIKNEESAVVQPPLSGVNAYATGSGIEAGLATNNGAPLDPNQIILAGKAEHTAPPNTTATTKQIGPIDIPGTTPPILLHAALLTGRAAAVYDPNQCPIGVPISYGLGAAADVSLITPAAGALPVANTAGTGTSTAQSDSATFLSANGDGTFGLTSQARDTIAPVTASIPNVLKVTVTIAGTDPNQPITLDAVTTGKSTGGAVTLKNAHTVTVVITPTPGGISGTPITIGPIDLTTVLPPALQHIDVPGLAHLDIDNMPHAIGGLFSSAPTIVGGTVAAGAIDIVHLQLGPPALRVADLAIGHLEASANLAAAITCGIPVTKTATPSSVTAGHPFVYTIQIPDPAKLPLLDCDLANITATDTITDVPGGGSPTFQINSVSNGGVVKQTSPSQATVTWTGLSYKIAPHGSPPNPPITLTINVTVPTNSPAGTIRDLLVATGAPQNCQGGASNISNIGGVNGGVLTGTIDLDAPSVTAVTPTTPTTASPSKTTTPAKLPFTGAIGGPWQPIAGLGVLGLGGAALALVRRSRRRLPR